MFLENYAGGGVNGAAVLTTDTQAGDPWSFIDPDPPVNGVSIAYTTQNPLSGATGYVVPPQDGTTTSHVGWNLPAVVSAGTDLFGRFYYKHITAPPGVHRLVNINNSTTSLASIKIGGTSRLFLSPTSGTTVTGNQMTTVLTAGRTYRVEWRLRPSSISGGVAQNNGEFEIRLFDEAISVSTAVETKLVTSSAGAGFATFGTNTIAGVDRVGFGVATAAITNGYYIDQFAVASGLLAPDNIPATWIGSFDPTPLPIPDTYVRVAGVMTLVRDRLRLTGALEA